jgi:hypothetical protein
MIKLRWIKFDDFEPEEGKEFLISDGTNIFGSSYREIDCDGYEHLIMDSGTAQIYWAYTEDVIAVSDFIVKFHED